MTGDRVNSVLHRAKIYLDIARAFRPGLECPFCGNRFLFWVVNRAGGRRETLCRRCGSLERHRRTVLLLRRHTNLYDEQLPDRSLLHVAPADCLQAEIRRLPNITSVTGDIDPRNVDIQLDLTALDLPDNAFDVILCSHVLEHIPDDHQAMLEMFRVLRPGGWALINVPSDPDRTVTYEDPTITDRVARLAHFGQEDHVRIYAAQDFVARLESVGVHVVVDPATFSPEERRRYQLDGDIGWDHSYLCRHSSDFQDAELVVPEPNPL